MKKGAVALREAINAWMDVIKVDDYHVYRIKRHGLVNAKRNGQDGIVLITEKLKGEEVTIGEEVYRLNFVFDGDELVTCNCQHRGEPRAIPLSKDFFQAVANGEVSIISFTKWMSNAVRIMDVLDLVDRGLMVMNRRELLKEVERILSNALKKSNGPRSPEVPFLIKGN